MASSLDQLAFYLGCVIQCQGIPLALCTRGAISIITSIILAPGLRRCLLIAVSRQMGLAIWNWMSFCSFCHALETTLVTALLTHKVLKQKERLGKGIWKYLSAAWGSGQSPSWMEAWVLCQLYLQPDLTARDYGRIYNWALSSFKEVGPRFLK